jgi:hypothetical protein
MIDKERIFQELESEAVLLTCEKHRYVAARRNSGRTVVIPPESRGCANCWKVFFITDLALTPPSKRAERLDELEEVIHHAIDYERKGTFGKDFELYNTTDPRFRVDYEKGKD